MALTFVDSPNRYETGDFEDISIASVWSNFPTGGSSSNARVDEPVFGSRTGVKAFYCGTNGSTGDMRASLANPAAAEVYFALAWYAPVLPTEANTQQFRLHDSTNALVCYFNVQPSGTIALRNSSGTIIAETAAPVIIAGTWTFLEFRVLCGAGTGVVQIRDQAGGSPLSVSALNIPGTIGIIVPRGQEGGPTRLGRDYYFTDLSVKDTTGTENNTWYASGGVANYLLKPNADVVGNAWSFVARKTFNNGVGYNGRANDSGFYVDDAATLEIGAGDFTVEGTFRWDVLPSSGSIQTLVSKWRDASNLSWRLYSYESGGNTFIAFATSTDGTTGTETIVHNYQLDIVKWQKYTISVSRASGSSRMFIDGVRVGPVVADAATYFNGSAQVAIAGQADSSVTLENGFIGWMDEVRYTVGVGRYTAEYTPATTAFPRDVGGDPSFSSVQLLVGWDDGLVIDQSGAGRTITTRGTAEAQVTDDGDFAFQSIDKTLRDDTFIEAKYIPASGTLEFGANPLDTETVVIGSQTYTFNTTLGGAGSVLIGIDQEASLDNLVAAVENGAGEGTLYGTGTTANANASAESQPGDIIGVFAIVPGTAGNSLTFTTSVTGATISGSGTLAGGIDIPAASDYVLERLPRGITRVDGIALFTRRSVFGVGGAQLQPGFVDSSLAVSNGADVAAPANPAWQTDILNNNGGSPWTVIDMLGSKVRVNRTV